MQGSVSTKGKKENMKKASVLIVCLALGLLMLGGCGDKIAGEVQKAVGQVKEEASKVASEKIESMSTAAIDKLKKMQGQTGKQKSEGEPVDDAGEKAEKTKK
jgi:outer membrane lipoprotein-sorting protein